VKHNRLLDQLLVNVINAREMECARVSKLLHDQVGQVLSAVGLQLDVLRLDLKDKVPEIGERTSEIQQVLEQAVKLIRDLSFELHPAVVERAGLQFAIDQLVGRFRSSFSGTIRLFHDSTTYVPAQIGAAMYKVAEQALENAVQHSGAEKIEVLIRPIQGALVLEVRDNGKGFSYQEVRQNAPGLGLLLMEHYASQAELDFVVRSSPGKGATIRAAQRKQNGQPSEKES
jgi:signal transduction histidine kinase